MIKETIGEIFIVALTLTFVIAKIIGKLDWTWWWVFSPLWLPFTIFVGILVVIFVAALIRGFFVGIIDGIKDTKAREKIWKR